MKILSSQNIETIIHTFFQVLSYIFLKCIFSSDVNFHLLTYGGENKHWAHVTVNGKPIFKAPAPELKFSEAPKPPKLTTGIPDVDSAIKTVIRVFGSVKEAIGELEYTSRFRSLTWFLLQVETFLWILI